MKIGRVHNKTSGEVHLEFRWTLSGIQNEFTWTPGIFSTNMQVEVWFRWSPPGLQKITWSPVESTQTLWRSVKYCWTSMFNKSIYHVIMSTWLHSHNQTTWWSCHIISYHHHHWNATYKDAPPLSWGMWAHLHRQKCERSEELREGRNQETKDASWQNKPWWKLWLIFAILIFHPPISIDLLTLPPGQTTPKVPATTTTSLSFKCEPEVVDLGVSMWLPPPPPSHPNASQRWFFSAFWHDSHHHHLPHKGHLVYWKNKVQSVCQTVCQVVWQTHGWTQVQSMTGCHLPTLPLAPWVHPTNTQCLTWPLNNNVDHTASRRHNPPMLFADKSMSSVSLVTSIADYNRTSSVAKTITIGKLQCPHGFWCSHSSFHGCCATL